MSEVKRWEPRNTAVGYDMQPLPDGSFVLFEDFDRVTAERDALQQRLTAADERAYVLVDLLTHAHIAIHTMEPGFFLLEKIDAALKPAEGGGDE